MDRDLLASAMQRSTLTAGETTERALKLWVELYDLLQAGYVFTACKDGACQSVDFELLTDDPNKEKPHGC